MNYFPNGEEEISLIRFIAKFQYLNVNDAKYFFSTKKYYKKRITSLVEKKYLKRYKLYLILDELGIEYAKLFGFDYTPISRNKKYFERLLYISNLGAFYYNCDTVNFTPSFAIKDKDMLTSTARRFIGKLDINGIEYLTYHISEEHDNRYQMSVIYDIQKEFKFKNIIVLVDDIKRINLDEFAFGMNHVLVIEDNEENRERLKYLNSVNWNKAIKDSFRNKVCLAEYNFCEYTDYKNKYISTFYFLDTEKINRIKYFLRENKNKNADIICSLDLKPILQKNIPTANYVIVDLEKYVDNKRNVYD